jgi:hypothetical protein
MPRRRYPHASFVPKKPPPNTAAIQQKALIEEQLWNQQRQKIIVLEKEWEIVRIKAEELKPWCPNTEISQHKFTLNCKGRCMQCQAYDDQNPFTNPRAMAKLLCQFNAR